MRIEVRTVLQNINIDADCGDIMVVKAVRGRRRYIVFTMDETFVRETLIPSLRSFAGDSAPYVVQCSKGWCIVRCRPEEVEQTCELMKKVDPTSESKLTSGTLMTLRKKYPILQQLRPPARR